MGDFGFGTSQCQNCGEIDFRTNLIYDRETGQWEHRFQCYKPREIQDCGPKNTETTKGKSNLTYQR